MKNRGESLFKELYVFLLSVYVATVPIENLLGSDGGSFHKFLGIVILLFAIPKSLQHGKLILHWHGEKLLFSFIILVVFSVLWLSFGTSNYYIRTVAFLAIFTLIILQWPLTINEFRFLQVVMIVVGVIFSFFIIFGSRYTKVSLVDANRLTLTFNNSVVDNNNLAISLAVPVLFCLNLYLTKTKRVLRIVFLISGIIIILAILFSGSRGGLLGLVVGIMVFIWVYSGKRIKLTSIILSIIGTIVVIYFAYTYIPESIRNRFSINNVILSGGTGRTTIWSNALSTFINGSVLRWIIGYGFGSFAEFYRYYVGIYKAAHNDIIQILVELGVVGLVWYIIAWIKMISATVKEVKAYKLSILLMILVGSLSMELLIKKVFWVGIYLAFIDIVSCGDNSNNET